MQPGGCYLWWLLKGSLNTHPQNVTQQLDLPPNPFLQTAGFMPNIYMWQYMTTWHFSRCVESEHPWFLQKSESMQSFLCKGYCLKKLSNNASFTVILQLIHWLDQLVSLGPDSSSAQNQTHGVCKRSINFIQSVNIHQSQGFACIMYDAIPDIDRICYI